MMRKKAPLKRLAGALALVVWLSALTMPAALAEADRNAFTPYLGVWECEGATVTIRYNEEQDSAACRIAREADGSIAVWEYAVGWYDSRTDTLICAGCTRYTERVDPEMLEAVQDDWSMDDMECAWFSLSEDGERLIGTDIAGMDEPLRLRRQDGNNAE